MYEVLGTALHTENEEHLVIYRGKSGALFARPLSNFMEVVSTPTGAARRFEPLSQ